MPFPCEIFTLADVANAGWLVGVPFSLSHADVVSNDWWKVTTESLPHQQNGILNLSIFIQ